MAALQAENGALGEGVEMALWRRTVSQAVLRETLRELGRPTAEVEASRAEPGVGGIRIPAEVDKPGWENLTSSDVVEAIYSELVTTRRALAEAHQQVSELTSRESVSASP